MGSTTMFDLGVQIMTDMATGTLGFLQQIVYAVWPILLIVGTVAFVGIFILRKLSMARR